MDIRPAAGARVCLVDDDPLFRTATAAFLERSGYAVRAYPTALAFLEAETGEPPECLVLDLELPGLSGLELQQRLAGAGLPIVFVSGHAAVPESVRAMRGGAIDFLSKPFPREELLRAVEEALARGRAARAMARELRSVEARIATLSARERRVCELVVQGLTNAEIGALLGANENTVKSLRKRGMERLGVDSLPDLVRLFDRKAAGGQRA